MRPLPGGLAGAPGRRAIVGANDSALPHKSGCPLPGAPGATFGGFRGALSSRNGLLGPQAAGLGKHTLTPCVFILCTGGFIVLISLAKLPTSAPESTVSGEIVLRDRNFWAPCLGGLARLSWAPSARSLLASAVPLVTADGERVCVCVSACRNSHGKDQPTEAGGIGSGRTPRAPPAGILRVRLTTAVGGGR